MTRDELPPSKTRRKKQMSALQDLGAELVRLNDERLSQIELPENLRSAVATAKHIKTFEGQRRQLQYVGKLMRAIDPEPIRAQLEIWKAGSREHVARMHSVESWRERLLTEEVALREFADAHPHADARRLRALIADARRERAENKPPRSYRALYRLLQEIVDGK